MSAEGYGLWNLARSLSYSAGVLYFDGRTVAKLFKDTDKNKIYRVAKELTDAGWFKVLVPRQRNKKTGLWTATQYAVLSPEEWAKKYPHECKDPLQSSNRDRLLPPSTSPQIGTGTSPKCELSSPEYELTSPVIGTYSVKENTDKEIERESKKQKTSPPLTSSESGQEKALTDFIVKIAKGTNTDAAFDQKSKRALSLELSAITPPPTETELRNAVSSQVAAMDPFALQNAGSRIASSLVGAIAAIRDAAKAKQDRKDDKQTIERSEVARNDWRKKLDEATDIDQYVQDNPPPEWFVEYEGGKKSFPYADEYIDEARKSLSRREEPKVTLGWIEAI